MRLAVDLSIPALAVLGGGLSWIPNPSNRPDIAINWTTNQAWTKTGGLTTPLALGITTSRASVKQVVDASGNWTQVAANVTAMSNLGRSTEEARTNSVRNNTMVGAVVGADNVELLTNGNFAAQGTGWTTSTAGGGSVTFNTGSVVITGDASTFNNNISRQITGLTPGRSYVVVITSSFNTIAILVDQTTAGQGGLANVNAIGNGNGSASPDRAAFTAPANGTVVLSLARFAASPATLNSISVQDGERVENGGFTSNPINASQSTVQNGWQWFNNAGTGTVTYVGGNSVSLLGDGTHAALIGTMALSTVAGCTYTITVDVAGTTSAVQAGTTALGSQLLNVTSAIGTGQKFQFTATTTTSFVTFAKTSASTSTIANVSVQSAGALPSNWSHAGANSSGLIYSVQAVGTQNGIDTVDINYAGTTTNGNFNLCFDSAAGIASANGQTWSNSVFTSLVGGTLTNVSNVLLYAIDVGGGGGVGAGTVIIPTATLTRYAQIGTISNAGNTNVRPQINPVFSGTGVAVNMTLRIGWPQLELGASVTSPIKTTSAAVTRAADVTTLATTVGSNYALFEQLTPQAPVAYGVNQGISTVSDGTSTNRAGLYRTLTSGLGVVLDIAGGSSGTTPANTTALTQGSQAKLAVSFGTNVAVSLNGATALTAVATVFPTAAITQWHFGDTGAGTGQLDGLATIDAIWLTTALSNAELQAITT